ncbi:hypothetical protein NGRA_1977 [Nosema granulosis]|uniref:Uncharacterized protein n=1 Tax=Nosema granulosis TaxID=83296 RepID=A0A9P6GXD3_9MICR|nr:hypothetical protein NGRA_1977 [Nosema granulosis]
MDFLDNLILGKNTPRYADESTFPSRTYKKNLCRKKHCGAQCVRDSYNDWEYWAVFLTSKPINRTELSNKILNMKSCLRFGVWLRLIRDENNYNYNLPEQDKKLEDQKLVEMILTKFRNKNIDEEELFNILVSVFNRSKTNLELLLDFVYNILDLPFANLHNLREILEDFNCKYKLEEIFIKDVDQLESDKQIDVDHKDVEQIDVEHKNVEEIDVDHKNVEQIDVDHKNVEQIDNTFILFVEFLISKDFIYFCRIIDLMLCFANSTFKETINFFLASEHGNFKSLLSVQNLERLKDYFSKKSDTIASCTSTPISSPTYYDFIVVQNETIKAQENIKKEFLCKLEELENRNKELSSSLQHFKEVSSSLEEELADYQDGYVKDILRMLDEHKTKNDELEREVLRLKEELCRTKRKTM